MLDLRTIDQIEDVRKIMKLSEREMCEVSGVNRSSYQKMKAVGAIKDTIAKKLSDGMWKAASAFAEERGYPLSGISRFIGTTK